MKVAGFERGLRPIGSWSTWTSLSKNSRFSMCLCLPGTVLAPLSLRAAAAARTSFTSVLLPEPDTPVTQVRSPAGNRTSIPLRLCSRASRTVSQAPSGSLVGASFMTAILRARYGPVWEARAGSAAHSDGLPWNRSRPPSTPASGPSSTISSAARIVSSSCSTTRTVLPLSRRPRSCASSLSLSFGWRPMLGSSRT